MVVLVTDINMALGCIRTVDPLMALGDCMDHTPQHGLRWLHMVRTSAWLPKAAKPEDITSVSVHCSLGSSMGNQHQHGLWFTVVLLGGPSQKVNLFSPQAFIIAQSQGVGGAMTRQQVPWLS